VRLGRKEGRAGGGLSYQVANLRPRFPKCPPTLRYSVSLSRVRELCGCSSVQLTAVELAAFSPLPASPLESPLHEFAAYLGSLALAVTPPPAAPPAICLRASEAVYGPPEAPQLSVLLSWGADGAHLPW